jgi:hypothetical protein
MRACMHGWQQAAGWSREQASEAALAGLGPLEERLEVVEVRWAAAAKQVGAEVAGLSHALALLRREMVEGAAADFEAQQVPMNTLACPPSSIAGGDGSCDELASEAPLGTHSAPGTVLSGG